MLDAGHDGSFGGTIAFELVGDHHPRRPTLLLQQLAQQAPSGLGVAAALNKDVENKALLVNRASQPVFAPGDGDDDLVEMRFVAAMRRIAAGCGGQRLHRTSAPIAGLSHS
jgi:hypothetical protein